MNSYQNCALEGASAVELTVALYDGIIRFMRRAIEAVDQGDTIERRIAVRRAMDIVMHLQATLKMDVGGRPAEVLAESIQPCLLSCCRDRRPTPERNSSA